MKRILLIKKLLALLSIYNYSILFLMIMNDEGPKVLKLVKTNSALDFLKNNTSSASISEGTINKIQDRTSFNYYTKFAS